MGSLVTLLEKVGHEVEPQVRSQLGGCWWAMVRAYLPQTWVFRTEKETASLSVDRAGAVTVKDGAAAHPDVTIESTWERLETALRTRSKANLPPGSLSVTPHTSKGKTAFDFLRGRLGL